MNENNEENIYKADVFIKKYSNLNLFLAQSSEIF